MSATVPLHLFDNIRDRLNQLLDEQSSIYGCLLCTIDGHPEVTVTQKELHESKLAAITSSVIALGESLAHEARQTECHFVIVQNRDGFIVTQRLGERHALSIFATSANVSMGMLLSALRSVSEELEPKLA